MGKYFLFYSFWHPIFLFYSMFCSTSVSFIVSGTPIANKFQFFNSSYNLFLFLSFWKNTKLHKNSANLKDKWWKHVILLRMAGLYIIYFW